MGYSPPSRPDCKDHPCDDRLCDIVGKCILLQFLKTAGFATAMASLIIPMYSR
jgi:hypothetical protein